MEGILQQILARLDGMDEGQKQITQRLDGMEGEISTIKSNMATKTQLEGEVSTIKTEMATKTQQDKLEGKISVIKAEMATKTQQNENSQLIKALLHRTEELDAKFDALLHTTATKEAIAKLATKEDITTLDAKFEVLNSRLFHKEAELHRIQAIK